MSEVLLSKIELILGLVVLVIASLVYWDFSLGSILPMFTIFIGLACIDKVPALSLIPMFILNVCWVNLESHHLMLSGFLVYLIVNGLMVRSFVLFAIIVAVEWLFLAYFVSRGMQLFSDDVPALILEFSILGAAAGIGRWRGKVRRKTLEYKLEIQTIHSRIQDEWAVMLHDKIARSLSLVTVYAETASLKRGNESVKDELNKIILLCKEAVDGLSELLSTLGSLEKVSFQKGETSKVGEMSVGFMIEQSVNTLREFGYKPIYLNEVKKLAWGDERAVLWKECVEELVANVIKHGRKESEVVILVIEDDGMIHLTIKNLIKEFSELNERKFRGMGYATIARRVGVVGGYLGWHLEDEVWMARLVVPA